MFFFVCFNKGGQYLQPIPCRRVGCGAKEVFDLLQRFFVIIFRFDRPNVHILKLQSDGGSIDLVIFSMRSHKSNIDNSELIPNGRYEPVGIAFDVENYTVIGQEAGVPMISLDIRRRFPMSLFHIGVPCQQRLFGIRVRFPKYLEHFSRDDAHISNLPCSRHGIKTLL
jgi:hypothetical protein